MPNVIPTLLPCFIFHVRRGVWAAETTEDAQSQKVRCRRGVNGHNGEIKRKRVVRKLMNVKSAISKKNYK